MWMCFPLGFPVRFIKVRTSEADLGKYTHLSCLGWEDIDLLIPLKMDSNYKFLIDFRCSFCQ